MTHPCWGLLVVFLPLQIPIQTGPVLVLPRVANIDMRMKVLFYSTNTPLYDTIAFCWLFFFSFSLNLCSSVQISAFNGKPFVWDEHEIPVFHFNLLPYSLFL